MTITAKKVYVDPSGGQLFHIKDCSVITQLIGDDPYVEKSIKVINGRIPLLGAVEGKEYRRCACWEDLTNG